MYYWLNIDLPTSDAKLHVSSCRHAISISPTELKGVGRLKTDGGWIPFETVEEAQAFVRKESSRDLEFNPCKDCRE